MVKHKARKNLRSVVIGVMALAAVAVWQFYAFVTFNGKTGLVDTQGGRLHLWVAIGFGLIACVVAVIFFSAFLRYDASDEMHITSQP